MCHAVAAAAPAVHCNGIQPYRGAAWEEGRLLLLSSRGVINYLALCCNNSNRPLSRRLDRCDPERTPRQTKQCIILHMWSACCNSQEEESRDPNGGNVYYVTMQITFLTRRKFHWSVANSGMWNVICIVRAHISAVFCSFPFQHVVCQKHCCMYYVLC